MNEDYLNDPTADGFNGDLTAKNAPAIARWIEALLGTKEYMVAGFVGVGTPGLLELRQGHLEASRHEDPNLVGSKVEGDYASIMFSGSDGYTYQFISGLAFFSFGGDHVRIKSKLHAGTECIHIFKLIDNTPYSAC